MSYKRKTKYLCVYLYSAKTYLRTKLKVLSLRPIHYEFVSDVIICLLTDFGWLWLND